MSGYYQTESNTNLAGVGDSEAEDLIQTLHSLRDQIVTSWRERAVIFSDEEQVQLQEEIRHTCEFLHNLTMHP